jgi:hypothetical protein
MDCFAIVILPESLDASAPLLRPRQVHTLVPFLPSC